MTSEGLRTVLESNLPKFSIGILSTSLWRSWLRHCATSWKVAASIPDGVVGIFHWHNPSCRTMTLTLTQLLPIQEYFLRGKGSHCLGLITLPPSCADCLEIWEPQPPGNPQGLSRPVMGLLFIAFSVFPWPWYSFHSFSILSDDRSKASSKTIPPHSAI